MSYDKLGLVLGTRRILILDDAGPASLEIRGPVAKLAEQERTDGGHQISTDMILMLALEGQLLWDSKGEDRTGI